MPKPSPSPTYQTAVRFPTDWRPRLEAIAEKLHTPGMSVSQSDIIRVALLRGIESLEAEFGLSPEPAESAKRPGKR